MEVVINIDENLYTRLFDNGVDNYDDAIDMAKAIRKGTPLPKGHGRLGDLDELEALMKDEVLNHDLNEYGCLSLVKRMQGIIDADKEDI